jgi:hypothetical protein
LFLELSLSCHKIQTPPKAKALARLIIMHGTPKASSIIRKVALVDNNQLLRYFVKRARNGRPQKKGNLVSDVILVVPNNSRISKSAMAKKNVQVAKHRQISKTKVKLELRNYLIGEDKIELEKVVAE